MKNKEFYQKELAEIALSGCGVALMYGVPTKCGSGMGCWECGFSIQGYTCTQALQKWAEEEYVEPENDPFNIKEGDRYYCVDERGYVISYNSLSDTDVVKFGNACKDAKYVKRRVQEIKLYNLLSNFAYKVNEGWEPDWSDADQDKWFVYRSHQSHRWEVTYYSQAQCMNDVYFKTQHLAERAIEEVIVPYEK